MADFTLLPKVVICDHIFPHLQLNDLLRLRRVNKLIKPMAEDYLRLHVTLTSERFIKIDFDEAAEKNVNAFLALDFVAPASRFRIRNLKPKTWKGESIQEFVAIYGNKITHLQIDSFKISIASRKAIQFFESLPNLEYLKIEEVEEQGYKKETMASKVNFLESVPTAFRRLRTLIIQEYNCAPKQISIELVWKFIEKCSTQLEFLKHPMYPLKNEDIYLNLPDGGFGYVRKLLLEGPNPSNFKFFDIGKCIHLSPSPHFSMSFYELIRTCAEYNVKLLNVNGYLVKIVMDDVEEEDQEEMRRMIPKVVASTISAFYDSLFLMELENLEKIEISGMDLVSMPKNLGEGERHQWSSLRELNITIDSEFLDSEYDESPCRTGRLLDYLFVGIRRDKMEKLTIEFTGEDLPYPRIADVSRSCPNLKELTIGKWPGNNEDISLIWGNLQQLKKVTFKSCGSLGNAAFVGEDEEKPAFLNAQNLRSLTLEGLKRMPGIKDLFFTQVLRHMPLKELCLTSQGTLESEQITLAGVSSLLEGVFSETIEKLELSIELEGVPSENLRALEKEFRSSRMM